MGRTLWVRRLNREIIVFNSKELDRLVLACILLVSFLLVKLCVFGPVGAYCIIISLLTKPLVEYFFLPLRDRDG